MVYRKVTIQTTVEAEDILASALFDLGVGGVEIEDRVPLSEEDTKAMFIDILPDRGQDDGLAELSFYLEVVANQAEKAERLGQAERLRALQDDPSVDASYVPAPSNVYTEEEFAALLSAVRNEIASAGQFCQVGEGRVHYTDAEEKDWESNWKQYFRPMDVGNGILVKPSWEAVPPGWEGKICIDLDPGSSFGTGQHETTQLCLRALERYIRPGMEVADIGTGSGILGIAALLLGACRVLGTDLDGDCLSTVRENLQRNGISEERFHFLLGNAVGEENGSVREEMGLGRYDMVLANILSPVIALLIQDVASLLKPGGVFIASGILAEKEGDIRAAVEAQRVKAARAKTAEEGDGSDNSGSHDSVSGTAMPVGGGADNAGSVLAVAEDTRSVCAGRTAAGAAGAGRALEILEVDRQGEWICFVLGLCDIVDAKA